MNLKKIVKPNVLSLKPYSSARSEYNGENSILLDANESSYDYTYAKYPDPLQLKLKDKISQIRGVSIDNIFLGNGSDEIIDLLIRMTCVPGKDSILSLDPSYGMYKVSAAINDVAIELVTMNDDLTVNAEGILDSINDQKLIFICSPNNPNGAIIEDSTIERILEKSKGLVIVDEAYIDFSKKESWIRRIDEYPNLIVLQTFSKSWAGAGLRIGMAYCQKTIVKLLNKIKPPYNISAPVQYEGLRLLSQIQLINRENKAIISEREKMKSELLKLSNVVSIFPSEANFLLVRFDDAHEVYQALSENGIIVRKRFNQTYCDQTLRITIGTVDQNNLLIETIKGIAK